MKFSQLFILALLLSIQLILSKHYNHKSHKINRLRRKMLMRFHQKHHSKNHQFEMSETITPIGQVNQDTRDHVEVAIETTETQKDTNQNLNAKQEPEESLKAKAGTQVFQKPQRLPWGPLPDTAYKIAGPPGDGIPPAVDKVVKEGSTNTKDEVIIASHKDAAGYGNNVPHYAVVNNQINGIKLRDPIKVTSLSYFDEPNPNVDGTQTATEIHRSPTSIYYSPTEGILGDPTICISIKDPISCVHSSVCGWCEGSKTCINGTFKGPAKNVACSSGYSYGALPCVQPKC